MPELGVCRDTLAKHTLSVVIDNKAQQHSGGGTNNPPAGVPAQTLGRSRRAGLRAPHDARRAVPSSQCLPATPLRRAWRLEVSQLLTTPTPGRRTHTLSSAQGLRRRKVLRFSATARATCGRGDAASGAGEPDRSPSTGGSRLLTLPCTTACSPWRITFPGADSTRLRSHISHSRTRPLRAAAPASAAPL